MRTHTLALCAVALGLVLAGCQRKEEAKAPVAPAPAPPAPEIYAPDVKAALRGYSHTGNFDRAGYYLPTTPVQVGNFKLNHLGMGAASDFSQWEQGDRTSTFGPILLQFDDVTSPVETNELGGEAHSISVRVLPKAYSTDGNTIRFVGEDPKLGPVTFEGTFDKAALAAAKAEGTQVAVLTGTLEVGGTRVSNAKFTFFAGD